EVPVAFFVDEKKISRKKIVLYATILTFFMGLPSALSQGTVEIFTNFGLLPASICSADFLSHMNFIFGDFAVVLGALFASVFVGWVWGIKSATEEISEGSKNFKKIAFLWGFFIKYIIPIVITLILIRLFGVI
ncbi:MAG TPA: sodium-dependent transporter, partial [Candidatus Kapabacteria bacterium]|nr:sodium-dependent transporter [Candidatus Kapabacteria bacterium]